VSVLGIANDFAADVVDIAEGRGPLARCYVEAGLITMPGRQYDRRWPAPMGVKEG